MAAAAGPPPRCTSRAWGRPWAPTWRCVCINACTDACIRGLLFGLTGGSTGDGTVCLSVGWLIIVWFDSNVCLLMHLPHRSCGGY